MVAGAGLEPTTFGLWARRAANCSIPVSYTHLIDISNFGQHEFDFGVTEARKLVNKSKFQWISSNLKESSGKSFNNSKEYIVKNIGDFKVGFLGTTDGMETTIQTTEIYQEDIIKSIGENLEKLKKEKVDFIVLLTQ